MSPDSARFSPVLLTDDELFLQHVAPPDHPERGERLLAVRAGLALAGGRAGRQQPQGDPALPVVPQAYVRLAPFDATDEELARVHSPAYIEQLGHLAGRAGHLDEDTYLSAGSVGAARRAAGATVALVDALHAGKARSGIALPRPPGHHALADRAMGFCLLNNVAVGAAHARAAGRERVLILDWDVHHGNGTEAMFYDDPSVLFISLHQYPNYPGTGAAGDLGEGDGRGHNVNLPLPAGSTNAVYAHAFERIVLPLVEQFAPDFALVSCGFDAHERDPLADMRLTAAGYAHMTRSLLGVLAPQCPLGIVLEGGYDLQALAESSEAVASVLLSPGSAPHPMPPHGALPPQASDALKQIQRAVSPFWRTA